tara:strand:+ start:17 stop:484 length:468 start_codon:yes stop_codon:yes gene_type:complete
MYNYITTELKMILFDLQCDKSHKFECWFASSADYDKQLKNKMIVCPYCNSTKIQKSLMAPNINTKGIAKSRYSKKNNKKKLTQNNLENQIKKFRKYIEKNTDNVGKNFAEEARKIYYGESKSRPIRGESTEKEAQELAEEGIPFSQLPWYKKEDA